jgi:Na+/alanine symporter
MNCTGMKCKNCALNSCTVQMLKPLIESVVIFAHITLIAYQIYCAKMVKFLTLFVNCSMVVELLLLFRISLNAFKDQIHALFECKPTTARKT